MLKSLLLATSVVIGSGTGAIQNGAHFNETEQTQIVESQPKAQITNTSTETYELFSITTPDNYKTQGSYNTFSYNLENYRANILRQQSKFSNAATIICNSTSHLYTSYDPNDESYNTEKEFLAIIQITPYLNYTNGEFTLNLNLNLFDNLNEEYEYNLTSYLDIIETEFDLTQYVNMNNYGSYKYPYREANTIWTSIPANERTMTEYMYDPYDTQDEKLIWNNQKVYWSINKTIQITNKTKFIIVKADVVNEDVTQDLNNYAPIYIDNGSNVKAYVTRGGGTYEAVDIPGLLFDVLTMPFTFISRAFNVTLFPNTPYQLNIADVFIGIFAALVFIFVVKTFIKK